MEYRVIKRRLVQLKSGTAENPGDVFAAEDVERWVSVTELQRRGYIEPVEPTKTTKEVTASPVRKALGRPRKES